jgi:hypothetical protein
MRALAPHKAQSCNKQNSLSQWIHPTRTEHVLFSIIELAATTICARDCFASEPRWSAEQTRDLIYGCNVGSAALDQAEAVITKQTKTVCVCVCVGRPIRPPSHAGTMRKPSLQCRWIYTSMSVGFTQVDLHKYLSPQKARLEGV